MDNLRDIKVCTMKTLPAAMEQEALAIAVRENPENASRGAILRSKQWRNGLTLRVFFLDGDPQVQQRIREVVPTWQQFANIRFLFGSDPSAEIRITFTLPGSWSYIGTDAMGIPAGQPTMNYGWLTPTTPIDEYHRVVLHEFGHALGLIHEHQHPLAQIPWDRDAAYVYYMQTQGWTREQVDTQIFQATNPMDTQYSEYDKMSIMHYAVDNRLTVGDFEIGFNRELSETDKQFIGTIYPLAPKPVQEVLVGGPVVRESIGRHGEQDLFRFRAPRRGNYVIETSGNTDVYLTLADSANKILAEDDDSGQGRNARVAVTLDSGTYDVRVRHFRPTGLGDYSLSVRAAP